MSIDLVIALYTGFHFEGELRMLNRRAAEVTDGVIVAIGSFRGQTDCALAMHAQRPVYCVDPRMPSDGYPFGDEDRVTWMQNVLAMNVAAKVRPINLPSTVVASIWQEPIGLLLIDGDHTEFEADLEAWLPHVLPEGLVAVHDANLPWIQQTYEGHDDLTEIEKADITTIFRKSARYERYEYNGLSLETRVGVYSGPDKHTVQEVQSSYPVTEPLQTVIDAGANIGAFSAWVKQMNPDVKVLALEPEPGNFALLSRNVPSGSRQVVLNYDPALTHLLVDPINSGGHSLIDQGSIQPGQHLIETPPSVTLEDLMVDEFAQVDLLKLDIEGCETNVLMGAQDDTLKRIHRIVGERHVTREQFQPVIDRLESLGFSVEDSPHPELSVPPWNMTNRGLFTAVNQNMAWDDAQKSMADDQAEAYDASAKASNDSVKSAGYAKAAKEVRAKPGRKPKK